MTRPFLPILLAGLAGGLAACATPSPPFRACDCCTLIVGRAGPIVGARHDPRGPADEP